MMNFKQKGRGFPCVLYSILGRCAEALKICHSVLSFCSNGITKSCLCMIFLHICVIKTAITSHISCFLINRSINDNTLCLCILPYCYIYFSFAFVNNVEVYFLQ